MPQKAVLADAFEYRVFEDLKGRFVRNFLDVVVLTELKTKPLSGSDVISLTYKKFNLLLSPGTVYSLLYSLERKELIKARSNQNKRDYTLTEKGRETIDATTATKEKIKHLIHTIF